MRVKPSKPAPRSSFSEIHRTSHWDYKEGLGPGRDLHVLKGAGSSGVQLSDEGFGEELGRGGPWEL